MVYLSSPQSELAIGRMSHTQSLILALNTRATSIFKDTARPLDRQLLCFPDTSALQAVDKYDTDETRQEYPWRKTMMLY